MQWWRWPRRHQPNRQWRARRGWRCPGLELGRALAAGPPLVRRWLGGGMKQDARKEALGDVRSCQDDHRRVGENRGARAAAATARAATLSASFASSAAAASSGTFLTTASKALSSRSAASQYCESALSAARRSAAIGCARDELEELELEELAE